MNNQMPVMSGRTVPACGRHIEHAALPGSTGYIENTLTWLSSGCMVMTNKEMPVSGEDLDKALGMLFDEIHNNAVRRQLDRYACERTV